MNVLLDEPLRQAALEVASAVAARLQDPAHALEVARLAHEQSTLPTRQPWDPVSASYSHNQLALFFGQMDLCFPGQHWDQVAHAYLARAAHALEEMPDLLYSPGFFGGLTGMCFTTYTLSRDGTRYQRLLHKLDDILIKQMLSILRSPHSSEGVAFYDYDIISGPAGIGAYLLLRQEVPGADTALDAIIERLLFLSEYQNQQLRFFIPFEKLATQHHQEQYPNGAIDCGLAHGVPGPMAFFALAILSGIERPGLSDALRRLATWVKQQSYMDAWGINWPYAIPLGNKDAAYEVVPARAAWCYGSPGIARALWLAGAALHDSDLQTLASEAIQVVRRRPIEELGIHNPILCHGVAGLLQITLRFGSETGQKSFLEWIPELTRQLLDLFEPDSPLGFRTIEPGGNLVDSSSVLEGASGAALALLAVATDVEPAWDRMFLLS